MLSIFFLSDPTIKIPEAATKVMVPYLHMVLIICVTIVLLCLFLLYRNKFIYCSKSIILNMIWMRHIKMLYNYDYPPYTFEQLLDMFPSYNMLLFKYFWRFNVRNLAKDKKKFDYVMDGLTAEEKLFVMEQTKNYDKFYEAVDKYYANLGEKNV